MKMLGHRRYNGANLYHDKPADYLVFRVGDEDFAAAAQALGGDAAADPSSGNWGDLVGETALRLQRAAGVEEADAAFHRGWQDDDGDWFVLTDSSDEATARAAAEQALRLAQAAGRGDTIDEARAVKRVVQERKAAQAAPGVEGILQAARKRDVPVMRRGDGHYQLGWGNRQVHLKGLLQHRTSGLGFEIANDHERLLEVLDETGIPIPEGGARRTLAGCIELAEELRYPVAVKPLRGRGGVTMYVDNDEDLETAYDKAKEFHSWVVLQDGFEGDRYQVLVVGGHAVSAIRRGTAGPDAQALDEPEDVTDQMHPAVRLFAERAARLCFLPLAGVDIIARRIDSPLRDTRGRVVSVDPEPDLTIHRDASAVIAADLVPEGDARVPLVTVTGTNGKTTTVRLIGHILKYAGGRVGMACTGAVEVENEVILRGDYSGPTAARTVLQEPGISHAVCEVARGGILRRGLGYDRSDVGVFLNVSSDHLGQFGIETVDDLAALKSVVLKAVKKGGVAVLNADDERVWANRSWLVDKGVKVIPFTMDAAHAEVADHLAADPANVAVTCRDETIYLRRGPVEYAIAPVVDIPLTLEGAARFNIQNAMAAIAVAYGLEVSEDDVRAGLLTFNPSTGQLPGRANVMDLGGVKVMLDYGHNVAALEAIAAMLPRLAPGRRINVANASGNRRDDDLKAFGRQIASMYDKVYLCDPDPRRRKVGETAAVIEIGMREGGITDDRLVVELDEAKALRLALADAKPGDLVVLQADDVQASIELLRDLQRRLDAGESPSALNDELLSGVV